VAVTKQDTLSLNRLTSESYYGYSRFVVGSFASVFFLPPLHPKKRRVELNKSSQIKLLVSEYHTSGMHTDSAGAGNKITTHWLACVF
jgi:hypothetical protein